MEWESHAWLRCSGIMGSWPDSTLMALLTITASSAMLHGDITIGVDSAGAGKTINPSSPTRHRAQ